MKKWITILTSCMEDIPPVLLQHGNADTICPISQSERLYRAITETAGEEFK